MPIDGEYVPGPIKEVNDQVALYESTDGAQGNTFLEKPVVILTMKGAKSGKLRKYPLMKIESNGIYAVVASNGGGPAPAWYRNVVANPIVELQDGSARREMLAREVSGEEKQEWWGRADCAYPGFKDYRQTAGRQISILVLEPVEV
jgi:F420H(2)-dependent quinone reductase